MKHHRHTLYVVALAAFAASASPLRAGSRIAPHPPQSTKLPAFDTTVRLPIPQISPIMPHNPPVIVVPTAPVRPPTPALPATQDRVVAISPFAPHNPPTVQLPMVPPPRSSN